ncbi:hypothetical protein [Kineococcus rhizosphaerae]|uniref:Hydroxymethylpyrimidine pyrophosphatase-like HAD family hydrolase n=1 Tax=Kineococcus rhizosphaerae TaxID=559628 RepID=A0A2T0QYU1_9ACTN|nr:hypothetical protein [Kineococcus rhizosphaerae]PRY11552.1 hydroxymethylpyrimidine pyrophosphatase-like HAD family hydrolase [Kineococcus rhizosphaerae]
MTTAPPFGLLLDVDGPIASPVTRSISAPGLLDSLLELLAAGIPVVFNTGRSDEFLREQVVGPILAAGLPAGARLHAVCEKGAVTFSVTAGGMGDVEVDRAVAVPAEAVERLEALARDDFGDVLFVDGGKRAMVSLEQRLDVDSATYLARQPEFEKAALQVFAELDLGVTWKGVSVPDAHGAVDWRIDPTIISTDVESVLLGKDRGAETALRLLAADGPLPTAWRTVGDSRTDYAMADWLHAQGHVVVHVDVRPADGVPVTPYPVLVPRHTVHDEAGAAWLARLAAVVRGEAADDTGFDA